LAVGCIYRLGLDSALILVMGLMARIYRLSVKKSSILENSHAETPRHRGKRKGRVGGKKLGAFS
jgi:hypothetical protein